MTDAKTNQSNVYSRIAIVSGASSGIGEATAMEQLAMPATPKNCAHLKKSWGKRHSRVAG
jgi:hypothetical protein